MAKKEATLPLDYLKASNAFVRYLAERKIRPHIHARFPLAEAARAHQMLESRKVRGKLILKP